MILIVQLILICSLGVLATSKEVLGSKLKYAILSRTDCNYEKSIGCTKMVPGHLRKLCSDGYIYITQACELLAEEGLTPEDDNIEANERVFAIVIGPEYSGRVRTQGFGVTPTRFFPQSKSEEGGGSGSNFGQIASLREEFRSFRDNQTREFGSFCDEMRQFMQEFQMNHLPHGGSEMGGNDNSSDA
ncbi:hypothetical protein IEQ34_013234 [Dendrobium chrysotoxum]|uniref:Uncharacterized protein n=1 Tax=Dendrobium chrysotoxum TaxID=161865 RepID=A0AAV7G7U7_DENCH|nr:hypothetical protein IEQ34_013234 [Dendrobium chrysotoxum]